MGGYFGNIDGTNIPQDPRKRTKNHARLEVSFWFDISDETLVNEEFSTAADLLRDRLGDHFVTELMDEANAVIGTDVVHIDFRVSQ